MNREIKFRCWDEEKKIMWDSVGFRDSDVGRIFLPELAMINEESEDNKWINGIQRNLILQQFTGLKDKNGKEIWEGDIVKDFNWEERLCEVAFNGWSWRLKNIESGWWKDWSSDLEVIGNIYENPNLLKGREK